MIEEWKTDLKTAEERKKSADEETSKIDKEFAAAKDEKEKEAIKKKKEDADSNASRWKNEKDRLDALVMTKTTKTLEEDWSQTEAYALAGYRLLVNQCNKCHLVGNLKAQQETGLGPPLNLASDRCGRSGPRPGLPTLSGLFRILMPCRPTSSTATRCRWCPGCRAPTSSKSKAPAMRS